MTKKQMKQIINLIVLTGIVLWCVLNYKLFIDAVVFIFELIFPVLIGLAIAFIINVPMKLFDNKVFKIEKRKHKKLIRVLSMLISFVLIFGIVGLILFLIIPELVEAIISLTKMIPDGFTSIQKTLEKLLKSYPDLENAIANYDYKTIVDSAFISAGNIINITVDLIRSLVSGAVTLFIGIVISIYVLIDKENLAIRLNKILGAFFSKDICNKINRIVEIANDSFSKFITGQCLDAVLLGVIFFIVMTILRIPYALIISVLLTVTALIPFVGAFITLFVGSLLIAVTSPVKAIWYIIMFLVLQQFDDNIMYPRVVGKSVGVPPLLALIAIVIGGSLFGFIGMIISIPVASILFTLFKEFVDDKIRKNEKQD